MNRMDIFLIPGKRAAPQLPIHRVMGAESAALQIVRVHGASGVAHAPARQHVMAEQALFIGGLEAIRSVYGQEHSLDLLRNLVRHRPAGEGQIAGSKVTDALHPRLVIQPPEEMPSIRPLVFVGKPLSLALAHAPAGLHQIPVAPGRQLLAIDLIVG